MRRYDKAREVFIAAGARTLWHDTFAEEGDGCCMMAHGGRLYFLQAMNNEVGIFSNDLQEQHTWEQVAAELAKRGEA